MNIDRSSKLFNKAKMMMPGGVNSPVRSFNSVIGAPLFMKKGKGAFLMDVDNNKYIDFTSSWGPLIHGHAHPHIVSAIKNAVDLGTSFGTPTEKESTLAEMVIDRVPSIQKIRFVNSGTEATMSAVRLARAFTDRDLILKFEGCYHGHGDLFLSNSGSGLATLGQPASPGVPNSVVNTTITLPYNDLESVINTFNKYGDQIAAIIIEPIAGNMGVILPKDRFLNELRSITNKFGSLLIFDEVITGFRVAKGGAQEKYDVKPDLTTLGKIIGGGLPVGAYGGRSDIMEMIAPEGSVYQAGTLSGNPLSMAAGIATLELLDDTSVYNSLEKTAENLEKGILSAAESNGISISINRSGSMFSVFFSDSDINCFSDVKLSNIDLFPEFHYKLMQRGVYLPPSAFESIFISTLHTNDHINDAIDVFRQVF